MSKRLAGVPRTAGILALACVFALALAGAAGATGLPTLKVALHGKQGVSVSGSMVSGAVNVVSTYKGQGQGEVGLVRLRPGATFQQAVGAVSKHHGDTNALTPYGTLFVDASAPSHVQTVLTPGRYVALNITGSGNPGFAQFTVSGSSSPATLPRARSTEKAIEFAFRGPRVLHDGTMVRAENGGWLVHMIDLIGVPSASAGHRVVTLLKAGKDRKAQQLATGSFVNLLGPASPGAMQQQVLHAKPGYYVEACFMNTLDGREHTQLGMARLVRIVK